MAVMVAAASPALAQDWQGSAGYLPYATIGAIHVATVPSGLNVRYGPGVQYPRIGALPYGEGGRVVECIDSTKWCVLAFPSGGSGWVYMPMTRDISNQGYPLPAVDWRSLYRTDVPYIYAGTGLLNLRQGAGKHRSIIGKLFPGQGGYVQGCSPDAQWCLIGIPYAGVEGWVYMPLLVPAPVSVPTDPFLTSGHR